MSEVENSFSLGYKKKFEFLCLSVASMKYIYYAWHYFKVSNVVYVVDSNFELLKIIIRIKPYLATSNGELLIV